jgi:EAL domain-containing protein (putative c-di-GMP-specific phosphodiesterase class I)
MDADVNYATSVAHQLTSSLERAFDLNGVSAHVSASIGIAAAPTDATDVRGLMECADVAMYRSKLGGHPFTFFDQGLDSDNQWRLGEELRTAIQHHQFVLHYQPQLSLNTGRISAVEALVRWQHPKLGMLVPSRFISLAEHDLSVSVNISPTNLLDDGFTDLVVRLLARHDFPSRSLVLEITESSVIANFERSKSVIEELANLGVVLSIDDFGAGFTSLSYLSSLEVGELKLDCKMITDLSSQSRGRDRELVRSTIELGHGLGLRVVAEGVEDEATLDLLRELRCDLAQGYFISRPVLAEKIDFGLVVKAPPYDLKAEQHVLSGISI